MKFHVIYQPTSQNAQSPVRVIEQTTGQEVGWVNRYLDREYVRRLADTTLRLYAHNLLHFVRWWAERSSHRRCFGTRPHRIDAAGLSALPVQPTTTAFRFHHQRTASPSPIAPSATSSPTLLARSPAAFIKPILRRRPMGLAGPRGGNRAGCG